MRMALGARGADVLKLILGKGTRVAFIGVAVGGLIALWLADTIRGMLFNIRPTDPVVFTAAATVLLVVGICGVLCSGAPGVTDRSDERSARRVSDIIS